MTAKTVPSGHTAPGEGDRSVQEGAETEIERRGTEMSGRCRQGGGPRQLAWKRELPGGGVVDDPDDLRQELRRRKRRRGRRFRAGRRLGNAATRAAAATTRTDGTARLSATELESRPGRQQAGEHHPKRHQAHTPPWWGLTGSPGSHGDLQGREPLKRRLAPRRRSSIGHGRTRTVTDRARAAATSNP